jgi:hypothetical protein
MFRQGRSDLLSLVDRKGVRRERRERRGGGAGVKIKGGWGRGRGGGNGRGVCNLLSFFSLSLKELFHFCSFSLFFFFARHRMSVQK